MADVSDVYNTLAEWISNLLYPNGPQNPSALTYNGAPVAFRVYPGWPVTQNLNADLANGVVNVNVYPRPEEVNVSTLPSDWEITEEPTPTLTASVSDLSVTIGGTVTAGEVMTIFYDGTAQSYTALSSDTLDTIAQALSALISGSSVSGATVTLPAGSYSVSAQVTSPVTAIYDVKEQRRTFQIVVWAPSPVLRDQVAQFIDQYLGNTYRISLPDGSMMTLMYERSPMDDLLQKEGCWRRDLFYHVVFATTQTQTFVPVVNTKVQTALSPA